MPTNETGRGGDLPRDDARQSRLETVLLSHWSLWERNYTLSTFYKFLNDSKFYCVFHLQLCTVFNQHHSKEWPWRGKSSVFVVVNYWTVWVIFQGCDLMHMQPQILRCGELPRLLSWLLLCQRINCDPCCCWMSQDHCFDSGTFLKNSWKLEKSYSRCCLRFPYCNTGDWPCKESHKGYGSLVNQCCVLIFGGWLEGDPCTRHAPQYHFV